MRCMMRYDKVLMRVLSESDRSDDPKESISKMFCEWPSMSPSNDLMLTARILSAIGLNMRNKSELYGNDIPLKALFLLNNINHLRQSLSE